MKQESGRRVRGHKKIIVLGIIILILGCLGAGVMMTLTVIPDQPASPGAGYPYAISFQVSLPEGDGVKIGNLDILALQTGDQIALRIGDHREVMSQGERREVAARTATVQTLGYPVFQTGYRLNATWTGMKERNAVFRVTLETSRQIPEYLINRVMPAKIQITPA